MGNYIYLGLTSHTTIWKTPREMPLNAWAENHDYDDDGQTAFGVKHRPYTKLQNVLYLTLSEEYMMQVVLLVFLRQIFGPKKDGNMKTTRTS